MDNRQTHYEIFAKRNRKADWALIEAIDNREKALEAARSLYDRLSANNGSVRVDKEIYDPEQSRYQTVTVLALGDSAPGTRARDSNTAEPPCSLPEDLTTIHARLTIARVLEDWLARQRVTPLELLHRPDLAEKLEDEGTTLQHAIQKTAIAQASEFEANVQHFVKRLNGLVEQAIANLRERDKAGRLARIGDDGFAALVDRLAGKTSFGLRAAVADALRPARDWREKTTILLALANSLERARERETGMAVLDAFLAEVLAVPDAADAVAGEADDMGERLEIFIAMVGGKDSALKEPDARTLARRFKARELLCARATLIQRALGELRRPRRLKPGAFWEEIALSRRLADRMIALAGPDLPPEDVAEAFIYRSGRLVQPESIDEALAGAETAAEEVERLIRLEEALAGAMAKKKLAAYLRARLGAHKIEAELAEGRAKPLQRAAKLAALQTGVLNSGIPAEERTEIAAMLDRLCFKALSEAKVFESIASGAAPPLDRAAALLRLAAGGGLTRGRCQATATVQAQTLLRQAMAAGGGAPEQLLQIRTLLNSLAA